MSTVAFHAVVTITSLAETEYGSGIWDVGFDISDNEGLAVGYNVQPNDVIVLDTSSIEMGTLTRYTITSVASQGVFSVVARMVFDPNNGTSSPDLSGYDFSIKGLITRKTPNHELLNIPSVQIQQLPDKFSFYLLNYMNGSIVDTFSTTTGGGTGALKYSQVFGNTADLVYTITHNLGTADVIAQVRDSVTNELVRVDIAFANINTATVSFAIPPGNDKYRITIVG